MKQTQKTIKFRIGEVEKLMRKNVHLGSPETVLMQMATLTKYYSQMHNEEKDFLEDCIIAIEGKLAWHKPQKYNFEESQKSS